MKKVIAFVCLSLLISCGEKLIEPPANLIPRDKMILILKDLAVVNAAKGINIGVLKDNGIDPTSYVFNKYKIDSVQFVDSNKYYASIPLEYEAIYTKVDEIISKEKTEIEELKKVNDSLKSLERESKKIGTKSPESTDKPMTDAPK
ncbi:DUF4296 domain-containing protein [Maribacter sp. CXY002]|uniref:DUF4296 domain-containing protein n=1 Tax=Maribacter luteocoastalis TaxID=3407671 RepID=UPI003B66B84F